MNDQTSQENTPKTTDAPVIERVRHETHMRQLKVTAIERLTPHMIRATFTADDLDQQRTASPEDHVKLFLTERLQTVKREYTVRRFSAERREMVIDFVAHDHGPAGRWALGAKVGDVLEVGGPRGSKLIKGDIAEWLLIGDETALPAIGRRIEEAAPGTRITSLVAVPGAEDEQRFETAATLDARWLHRPISAGVDPAPFLAALPEIELGPRAFVWIAAESSVARALRDHFVEERGHPLHWLKAAGYWTVEEGEETGDL